MVRGLGLLTSARDMEGFVKRLYVLLLIGLAAGCSSPETPEVAISDKRIADMRGRIDKTVEDPVRAEALNEILDELEGKLKAYELSLAAKRLAIINASADYSTTREQLVTLYESMNDEMLEMMEYIQRVHFRLKEQAKPDEWKKLTGGRKKLFGFK